MTSEYIYLEEKDVFEISGYKDFQFNKEANTILLLHQDKRMDMFSLDNEFSSIYTGSKEINEDKFEENIEERNSEKSKIIFDQSKNSISMNEKTQHFKDRIESICVFESYESSEVSILVCYINKPFEIYKFQDNKSKFDVPLKIIDRIVAKWGYIIESNPERITLAILPKKKRPLGLIHFYQFYLNKMDSDISFTININNQISIAEAPNPLYNIKYLALGDVEGKTTVLNFPSLDDFNKEKIQCYVNVHSFKVTCLAISKNSIRLASGSEDATVRVIEYKPNLKTWDEEAVIKVADSVIALDFSPDGTSIAFIENDFPYAKIHIFNVETKQQLFHFQPLAWNISSLNFFIEFSKDGNSLLTNALIGRPISEIVIRRSPITYKSTSVYSLGILGEKTLLYTKKDRIKRININSPYKISEQFIEKNIENKKKNDNENKGKIDSLDRDNRAKQTDDSLNKSKGYNKIDNPLDKSNNENKIAVSLDKNNKDKPNSDPKDKNNNFNQKDFLLDKDIKKQ